jgi:hypothetical protein
MFHIKYTNRGFTNSGNEYVTIDYDDMKEFIQRAILILAKYAESTTSTVGKNTVTQKNKELFGTRKGGTHNNRLSILGGVVHNYFNKDHNFKNDISKSQLPYIENVINEYAIAFDEEEIKFIVDHF